MTEFKEVVSGYYVYVGGKLFGHLEKDRGFFTGPALVSEFMIVSPEDLTLIAKTADEVKRYGHIPVCELCGGTPNFPMLVTETGKVYRKCRGSTHPVTHIA